MPKAGTCEIPGSERGKERQTSSVLRRDRHFRARRSSIQFPCTGISIVRAVAVGPAGAIMQIPGGGLVCMRFERPYDQGPMDQEVRERLNRLRPHLARAAFLFTKLGLRQARSDGLRLAVHGYPRCGPDPKRPASRLQSGHGDPVVPGDCEGRRSDRFHDMMTPRRNFERSLARITAGLFDQLRGPIPLPATEEHGAAVAYLIPMRGAAQDLFGCETHTSHDPAG